jgi:hypothetical protein
MVRKMKYLQVKKREFFSEIRHNAALQIQAKYRAYQAYCYVKQYKERLTQAVIKIQSCIRRYLYYKKKRVISN